MPIYTRTGDDGTTALFGGKRILKCEELVDVYGSIDELNSWIGLVASYLDIPDVQQFLHDIQADLFVIGSTLAGGSIDFDGAEKRVKEMEARIDAMETELPKIHNFLLPGGTTLSGHIHVARSICRRVERQTVALAQREKGVNKGMIKYLNRLSDLLFTLARFINNNAHVEETAWIGKPRQKF